MHKISDLVLRKAIIHGVAYIAVSGKCDVLEVAAPSNVRFDSLEIRISERDDLLRRGVPKMIMTLQQQLWKILISGSIRCNSVYNQLVSSKLPFPTLYRPCEPVESSKASTLFGKV